MRIDPRAIKENYKTFQGYCHLERKVEYLMVKFGRYIQPLIFARLIYHNF